MSAIAKVSGEFFNDIYLEKLYQSNKRVRIVYGGSSSGKSKYIADEKILGLLEGRNCLACRKVGLTIEGSIWKELLDSIDRLGLDSYFKTKQKPFTITCKNNDRQIVCIGLDDVEKVKGIRPKKGCWDDVWIDEATEISEDDYKQLRKRQRGLSKFRKRIDLSFNPIVKSNWIYKRFFGIWEDNKRYAENDQTQILKVTYKDNRFLDEDTIYDLENEDDEYYYEVYTLGNWGVIGETIFKNWSVQEFDDSTFDNYRNGLDWGFAKDPLAILKTHYDSRKKIIYIIGEVYEAGVGNAAGSQKAKQLIGDEILKCDSAEPKSIDEFVNYGINAYGARKGSGSIENGIRWLQEQKIIIHPRCINFKNEIEQYQYKKDKKTGIIIKQPVDKNNHLMDALRYAYEDENCYMSGCVVIV